MEKPFFSAREINFQAEQEPVTILPRYSMNGTKLIGASLPNLRVLSREQVPLWLALILKKQDKCNVVIPEWLGITYLKTKYDEELADPNKFSDLPWHWLPVSKMLLERCADDFIDAPHELRTLLQDLREVRQVKARRGIKELNDEYLQLDGLSLMEINEIRPFIIESMDELRKLAQSGKTASADGPSQVGKRRRDSLGETQESSYYDTMTSSAGLDSESSLHTDSAPTRTTHDSSFYNTSSLAPVDEDDDEDSDVEYRR